MERGEALQGHEQLCKTDHILHALELVEPLVPAPDIQSHLDLAHAIAAAPYELALEVGPLRGSRLLRWLLHRELGRHLGRHTGRPTNLRCAAHAALLLSSACRHQMVRTWLRGQLLIF